MARPESVANAGYFPFPTSLLPAVASLVEFEHQPHRPHVLVDPCAGDGRALEALAGTWFSPRSGAAPQAPRLYAIEIERGRFRQLDRRVEHAHHGDAFRFSIGGIDRPGEGSSLLFLNPPYDVDRLHGRLEQRFLERWTSCLAPGAGLLVFVVPHYSLAASAAFLARHYENLGAWRFPGAEFEAFRQCVLLAKRRAVPVAEHEPVRRQVERWAGDASLMPELPTLARAVYTVAIDVPRLHLAPTPIDLRNLLADFRPWLSSALVGTDRTVSQLIGATYPVALPPRPAHIALALSGGMLNGLRVDPDRPELPPLLVKGALCRDFVTADERFNAVGERLGSVQVQRPHLSLQVLRLDTLTFHELRPGAVPSGAVEIADFNSADLLGHYGASLGQLMRRQFPAIHDPADPRHTLDLPPLARRPYARQRHLICAGLKLLARGENPLLSAEVGTGKSTVALTIAAALQPRHFLRTAAGLRRLGFDTRRLRRVRRLLVICPPHLVKSWTDQAAAVLPGQRVVVVARLADLDREAPIYVLSRELAKLGHGVAGVTSDRCPRCGRAIALPPEAMATARARCDQVERAPKDRPARLAEDLAVTLLRAFPDAATVRHLVRRHRTLERLVPADPPDPETASDPKPLDPQALRPHVEALLVLVEGELRAGAASRHLHTALHHLSSAAGMEAELQDRLRQKLDSLRRARPHGNAEASDFEILLASLALRISGSPPAHTQDPDPVACLDLLAQVGTWQETVCGEPLFQAAPSPRRYPLARWILRRHRRRFDLLVLDEAHEFSTIGSAQEKAAHRLVQLPGVPTLALSGSIMGGYASSLFANFWALSRTFRKEFRRTEKQAFVSRYGYRKIWVPDPAAGEAKVLGYGAKSDRETLEEPRASDLGESPGILPSFLLRHLLPIGLIMHKADLEDELPPCVERPVPIRFDPADPFAAELEQQYRRLMAEVATRIRKDLYTKLAGKLWGAMAEAPSYLDRAADDLTPFLARYPADAGGALVFRPRMFPAAWLTPKERWLLGRLSVLLGEGRNVLLFLRHTGPSGLPRRIQRLVRAHLGQEAVVLDPRKVRAADREAWLDEQVIRPGRRILLANAQAVETGLNNLVHFSAAIWLEGLDYDARATRQANGRLHRIGQRRDVLIEVPYYERTVQKAAVDLVAAKITASVQVDGLSLEGALESVGAGTDEGLAAALGMGHAIYDAWLGRRGA